MANENLMNSRHKAHTQASRDGYEATFGKKCHWHGCRPAVSGHLDIPPNGTEMIWICQECYEARCQKVS